MQKQGGCGIIVLNKKIICCIILFVLIINTCPAMAVLVWSSILMVSWHFMMHTFTAWDTPHDWCLGLVSSYDAHLQEWDQVTELNQLEQFLRQPDAVMEPNIMEKLRQYVAKGGSPRDVVEMLTDSYLGTDPTWDAERHSALSSSSESYSLFDLIQF